MIGKLPNSNMYKNFAYHVSLLKEFTGDGKKENDPRLDRSYKSRKRGSRNFGNASLRGSFKGGNSSGGGGLLSRGEKAGARRRTHGPNNMNGSIHSEGSYRKNNAGRAASFNDL